jgi:DNA-binding MarR family transcriptional regulator
MGETTTSVQAPVGASEHDARAERIEALGLAFRRVYRLLSRLRGRDTHLAEGQLSHAQYQLLLELHDRGELSVGELAGAAELTPGTVTQMLEALAESGHVERLRSSADRRVVVSRLTPLGDAQIEAKRAAWKGRWESALVDFDAAQLQAAEQVLVALAGMLGEDPGRGPAECSPEALSAGRKRA